MAFREVDMWEIFEVLRRIAAGEYHGSTARGTGKDRKTVRSYIRRARALGWDGSGDGVTEALAGRIQQSLRPVAEISSLGASEDRLLDHRQTIRDWLKAEEPERRGLRLTKVHQLLRRRGVEVPYSSLHRFAVQQCGFADRRRSTVRLARCRPGEVAEVDFGRLGLVFDPEQGRNRVLHALIVTLVHSAHQYVHTTHSQKLPDVIEGLEEAFEYFGGVPRRVILDNMKAAITKADRYEPQVQRVFEAYSRHRDFIIDAAVVRHPTGKPHVERQVQYVRDNFFAGEEWRDREHVQERAVRWCTQTAGMRVHGTTRKRPLVVFEEVEKPALKPLTKGRFVTPTWGQCKVHPDHHIQFLCASYSVPTRYIGQTVDVCSDGKLVRIYARGEQIKLHTRVGKGQRSTDHADYPSEKTPYTMRSPDRCIAEARRHGPDVSRFVEQLLEGDFPWAHLRQAQQILRLCAKYGAPRTDAACRTALAFDILSSPRVKRILEQGLEDAQPPASAPAQILQLPLRFARAAGSFSHSPAKGDRDE